jgi:putative tryptophan/tyrosine transport system substrate-binding protein
MINRRQLLALLAALPASRALAQLSEDNMRRIGVLSLMGREQDPRLELFRHTLARLGHVEGKNLAIEWRASDDHVERLPALVTDLLEKKVEVIVAAQTAAIEAARKQTASVPIVFLAAFDPVGNGFAKSLQRPGLNMTGVSNNVPDIAPRQLELVRLAVPHADRLAVVLNHRNRATAQARREYEAAAAKLAIDLRVIQAGTAEQLLAAVGAARSLGVKALVVQSDGIFFQSRDALVRALATHKLPALFTQVQNVEAGGLMSYGPDIGESYRRGAYYVDRLLKGAKAAELPIEAPTKIELVINLKAASALHLALPDTLLKQANRILK